MLHAWTGSGGLFLWISWRRLCQRLLYIRAVGRQPCLLLGLWLLVSFACQRFGGVCQRSSLAACGKPLGGTCRAGDPVRPHHAHITQHMIHAMSRAHVPIQAYAHTYTHPLAHVSCAANDEHCEGPPVSNGAGDKLYCSHARARSIDSIQIARSFAIGRPELVRGRVCHATAYLILSALSAMCESWAAHGLHPHMLCRCPLEASVNARGCVLSCSMHAQPVHARVCLHLPAAAQQLQHSLPVRSILHRLCAMVDAPLNLSLDPALQLSCRQRRLCLWLATATVVVMASLAAIAGAMCRAISTVVVLVMACP